MKELIVSTTVFLTVLLALAFGVALGYACVCGLLRAMGHRTEQQPVTALKAAEASGD